MPVEAAPGVRGMLAHHRGLIFPALIVTSVLLIVAPLPPLLMDLLLSCNVTMAVIILLTTIYVGRPLEFSVFPSILLGTTLTRLVLNVASTRLILSQGATHGTEAAGGVIEAFGQFVAGGQIIIGLTLFAILVAIQFLVITKGATRISEVAARFALDGMPGKQMAIDADLNAGLITQQQAKARREEIARQADFYGAMDGASKFVRGDAIAGIVITLINIIAGLSIGMFQHGMEFTRAAEVFTTLTVGDGLVTQVPAFLISLAAGLIVTRSSADTDLPRDVVGQTFAHPEALFLAAGFLAALSFTGLPSGPLLFLGLGCAGVGLVLHRGQKESADTERAADNPKPAVPPASRPEDQLLVDPLQLELGVGLIRLADPSTGGDLLKRVGRVRDKLARELGILLPKVRIRDNLRLGHRQYRITIRDVPVASGEVYPDGLLAIDTGAASGELRGIPADVRSDRLQAVRGPAEAGHYKQETTRATRPAQWIESSHRQRAERLGYRVLEPSAVLIEHLTEVAREHSHELLTRQHVHQLLDNLKASSPKVVEELVPEMLKPSQVQQILSNLLRERVPVRDLETILETLSDYADRTQDLDLLTEYVRSALARTICQQYRDEEGVLHVITLDPALEDVLADGFPPYEGGIEGGREAQGFGKRPPLAPPSQEGENAVVGTADPTTLSPKLAEQLTQGLAESLETLTQAGHPPVVLCGPRVRSGLRRITSSALPQLAVISTGEITRETRVESMGQLAAESLQNDPLRTGPSELEPSKTRNSRGYPSVAETTEATRSAVAAF